MIVTSAIMNSTESLSLPGHLWVLEKFQRHRPPRKGETTVQGAYGQSLLARGLESWLGTHPPTKSPGCALSPKKGEDSEPREQNQKTTETEAGCPTLWKVHYNHIHATPGTLTCHTPPQGLPDDVCQACSCPSYESWTLWLHRRAVLWPELTPTQSENLGLNPMPLSSQASGLTPCTPSLACSCYSKNNT